MERRRETDGGIARPGDKAAEGGGSGAGGGGGGGGERGRRGPERGLRNATECGRCRRLQTQGRRATVKAAGS